MFGAKKTNINRHKSWAMENGKNLQKITEAEDAHKQLQVEAKAKTLVLQKERVAEEFQALKDGDESATASRKLGWMYESDPVVKPQDATKTMTGKVEEKTAKVEVAPFGGGVVSTHKAEEPVGFEESEKTSKVGEKRQRTGLISEEEAAEIRRKKDLERKRRSDPLAALEERKKTATAAPTTASALTGHFDTAKALAMLKAAAMKK